MIYEYVQLVELNNQTGFGFGVSFLPPHTQKIRQQEFRQSKILKVKRQIGFLTEWPAFQLGEDIKKPATAFSTDDEIPLKVIEFDKDQRKIILSVREYFEERDRTELEEFMANRLSKTQAEGIRAHLEHCKSCNTRRKELQEDLTMTRRLRQALGIDGEVYLHADSLRVGDFVEARITETGIFDLKGELVK